MSQSPLDPSKIDEANDPERPFRKALTEVGDILDAGGSLSGNERNCAFLNLGGARFATVSAVTGLDAMDDSRTPVATDWDHDGDLDLWLANRTAPGLRFYLNDAPRHDGWVAFDLKGTTANRDALGAEVSVTTTAGLTHRKTLKSGDGFLAGGSKRLHFGLGHGAAIETVTVRWPGGATEDVRGVRAGGRFAVAEGSGSAVPVTPAAPPVALDPAAAAAALTAPREDGGARAVRAASLTFCPRLPYESFGGETRSTNHHGEDASPLLVNLWAAWCAPCLAELRDFTRNAAALRNAGIDVLALSTDELDASGQTTRTDAAETLATLAFAFESGVATPETLHRLQAFHRHAFGVTIEFPVPTSVLLTADGRVAAWYFGPVAVDRVTADAEAARALDPAAYAASALPFPGWWFERPTPLAPLDLALDLMERGHVADADEFVRRAASQLGRNREFAKLRVWIGDELMKLGSAATTGQALGHYRTALDLDPDNLIVLNNVAWQLATHENPGIRDPNAAVRYAEKAATLTKRQNPAVLDTLAAAYAADGQPDKAAATLRQALPLAAGDPALTRSLKESLARLGQPPAQ